jgi:hypothetical protein
MPEEQRKSSWSKRHKQTLIGLVLCVLLSFLLLSVTSASSRSNKAAQTDQASNAREISNWCTNYCYIDTTLRSGASLVVSAAAKQNWAVVAADSLSLGHEVRTAMTLPVIPDAKIAAQFRSALMNYQQAAQSYAIAAHYEQDGTADGDSSLTSLAVAEAHAGASSVKQGGSKLQAVDESTRAAIK